MSLRNKMKLTEGNFFEALTRQSFRGGFLDEDGSRVLKICTASTYDPKTNQRRNPSSIGRDHRDEKLADLETGVMKDFIEYPLSDIAARFEARPEEVKPITDLDVNIGDLVIFQTKQNSRYGGIYLGGYVKRVDKPNLVEVANYYTRELDTGKIRHVGWSPRNWPFPRINQKQVQIPLGALEDHYLTIRTYDQPFVGTLGTTITPGKPALGKA